MKNAYIETIEQVIIAANIMVLQEYFLASLPYRIAKENATSWITILKIGNENINHHKEVSIKVN